MDASDPRYPVIQRLLAYWRARSTAADTLEGICRWWLPDPPVPPQLVDQALAWLVANGVITAHGAVDGRVRYRLERHRP